MDGFAIFTLHLGKNKVEDRNWLGLQRRDGILLLDPCVLSAHSKPSSLSIEELRKGETVIRYYTETIKVDCRKLFLNR